VKLSPPGQGSGSEFIAVDHEKSDPERPFEAERTRPWIERRRTRRLQDSRLEASQLLEELRIRNDEIGKLLQDEVDGYKSIIDDALVGIFQMSPSGRPVNVNRTLASIHGYDSPAEFMADAQKAGHQWLVDPSLVNKWKSEISANGVARGVTAEVYCRNGSKRWVSLNLRAARGGQGGQRIMEGTAEDITERKLAEDRVFFLAHYDTLTGLPNRRHFCAQLVDTLCAAYDTNCKAAIILFKLKRFSIINESYGHQFGDRVLQEIAERIKKSVGEGCIVARISGGEFAIALGNLQNASEATAAVEQISANLSSEFALLNHALNISFNAGVSIFPEHGKDGDELLNSAGVAVFTASEEGPNQFRFFTEKMKVHIKEQLWLENGLRLAVERNELFLLYQPQVNIRTQMITGVEALLRWQHPQLGLVPPGDFIGIAESSGLIVPIGEWVLKTACSQAKEWQDAGLPAVPVAVNVSALQFRQQGFPELIGSILRESGLEAKYLELELTESLLLTNADVMFSILQELRGMGVKLAIDDFGTGYSSLSYLRQFQVNRLKIDRSFVRDVAVNRDDAAITTAIIGMAKALNLDVLAEGVENEAQLSFLRAQHCYDIQGFYFSKPVSVGQIAEQLRMVSIKPTANDPV
jgi:diguanylate cyclase (GGDEF)-like protein/PAS domain S-box-containing protein